MLVGGWWIPITVIQIAIQCAGLLMCLLALCFGSLTVSDDIDGVLIAFGPLPVFRRKVAYAAIESAERARTTILDGWGIHLSPGGGWTWNLWGFDCVKVRYRKGDKLKTLNIGTDDVDGLVEFLRSRRPAPV